ncbi:MAG: PilZ domain-containing protein [Gammaproteobacteria bacterium]
MEKRYCRRKPVALNAAIYYRGRLLANCHIKDISLCGTCLLTGPLAFFRGAELKIKFLDYSTTNLDSNTIYGTVVRNNANEAGIAFNTTKPYMLSNLLQLATERQVQLPH